MATDVSPTRSQRTLAILRGSCIDEVQRRAVESRIVSAGFDVLGETFVAEDESLIQGPAVVLVLQRHRAVATWLSIVSSTTDEYGADNLAGCPTGDAAEGLIELLFPHLRNAPTSLPASPAAALSTDNVSMLSPAASAAPSEARSATSSQPSFRARNLPMTHAAPDIAPRMSRAAMLRMGLSPPPPTVRKRSSTTLSSEPERPTPGVHRRPLSAQDKPKSIAAPSIAPRPTRASNLRTGQEGESTERARLAARRASSGTAGRSETADFASTPGHRRQSLQITVASTREPSIAPRQTKASALRTGGDAASSPAPLRERVALGTAERARAAGLDSTRVSVASTRPPTTAPRQTKASALRQGVRPASAMASFDERDESARSGSPVTSFKHMPVSKRSEESKVSSTMRPPSIVPRANKSAMLRATAGGAHSPTPALVAKVGKLQLGAIAPGPKPALRSPAWQ